MDDASIYWSPICRLVMQRKCWVRMHWRMEASTHDSPWGQLLTIPTRGYLECSGGPIPVRSVEWVEISTMEVFGGLFGRPRRMVDVKEAIVSGLRETQANW